MHPIQKQRRKRGGADKDALVKEPDPRVRARVAVMHQAKNKKKLLRRNTRKMMVEVEEEWRMQKEEDQERSKDKEKSEEVGGANQKDGPGISSPLKKVAETIDPSGQIPRAEEEQVTSAFWTQDQADIAVSDATYENITALRSQFPGFWKKLMEHETSFVTDEEALVEVREVEREVLAERSQEAKTQERKRRMRVEPDEPEEGDRGRKDPLRRESDGGATQVGEKSNARSTLPERNVKRR
jgi:hypothetical protein